MTYPPLFIAGIKISVNEARVNVEMSIAGNRVIWQSQPCVIASAAQLIKLGVIARLYGNLIERIKNAFFLRDCRVAALLVITQGIVNFPQFLKFRMLRYGT
jgi:hypothetical protein